MVQLMVVDDNNDIAQTIKMIVEKMGHEIAMAGNGQDFLDQVGDIAPKLVLLDVMMPGLNTKQILDELEKRSLEHVKVILVTVVRFSDQEQKELLDRPNVVDYVKKPFNALDLMECIKGHLE